MHNLSVYQEIVEGLTPGVCEQPSFPVHVTERHLQAMWLEQRYFRDLKTPSGEPIEVVSPGIWNAEAGPDFLKAHIRVGDQELFGDVELHVIDRSWYDHQHHQDKRYDAVILHVSLYQPKTALALLTSRGSELVRAYLEPALTISLKRVVQLIDLDLYPYRRFVGSGRCAQQLFRSLSKEKVSQLLSSAAYWRLRQKQQWLHDNTSGMTLGVAAGLAMTLGYKANAQIFFELFLWLREQPAESFEECLVLAMGVCGLFEEPYVGRWAASDVYCDLSSRWTHRDSPKFSLQVGQSRPYNHPVRRLATLCLLVTSGDLEKIWQKLYAIWRSRWAGCDTDDSLKALYKDLLDALPHCFDPYWSHHYLFETTPTAQPLSLLGAQTYQQMFVNVVLPYLLFCLEVEHASAEEMAVFDALYGLCRAPYSGKRNYLVHRFFGDTVKGKLLKLSRYEQGAFQIHRDFCVHYEASCEGCPFVERVKVVLE